MSETLTQRLRRRVITRWVHSTGESPRSSGFAIDPDCHEAADTIERQAAEIASLKAEAQKRALEALSYCGQTEDEISALRAQVEALTADAQSGRDLLLRLVCDLRWALGDRGLRMQPELVEYAREMRRDAQRWETIREARKSVQLYVYDDPQDACSGDWLYKPSPEEFDNFADAAMSASGGEG